MTPAPYATLKRREGSGDPVGFQSPATTSDLRRYGGTGGRPCYLLVLVNEFAENVSAPYPRRREVGDRSRASVIVVVDEEPDLGAEPVLARAAMMPGMPERRTLDYLRHGITSLFAAFDAATSAKSEQAC